MISLISHPRKVPLQDLLTRFKPQVVNLLGEELEGFSAGRSTTDQILKLQILSEIHAVAHSKELQYNFIDFTKAFDGLVLHKDFWAVRGLHVLGPT